MRLNLTVLAVSAALLAAPAAFAQSQADLENDVSTPGDVLTYGMGYDLTRHSALTQINKDTVKRLVPAWRLLTCGQPRAGNVPADPQWRHVRDNAQCDGCG